MFERCFDKGIKQGVRRQGASAELGVELRAEHKGVYIARKFCDFHEDAVGRAAAKDESRVFELLNIFWIDLVAMTMTLGDRIRAVLHRLGFGGQVCFISQGSLFKYARIRAEAH